MRADPMPGACTRHKQAALRVFHCEVDEHDEKEILDAMLDCAECAAGQLRGGLPPAANTSRWWPRAALGGGAAAAAIAAAVFLLGGMRSSELTWRGDAPATTVDLRVAAVSNASVATVVEADQVYPVGTRLAFSASATPASDLTLEVSREGAVMHEFAVHATPVRDLVRADDDALYYTVDAAGTWTFRLRGGSTCSERSCDAEAVVVQ